MCPKECKQQNQTSPPWAWDLRVKQISLFLWTELLTEAATKKPLFQFVFQCFLWIVNKLWIIGALGFLQLMMRSVKAAQSELRSSLWRLRHRRQEKGPQWDPCSTFVSACHKKTADYHLQFVIIEMPQRRDWGADTGGSWEREHSIKSLTVNFSF